MTIFIVKYFIFDVQESASRQPIDPRVLKKLKELVRVKGITQTESIKAQLEEYVQTVLYTRETAPVTSNKRFFPEHKTLYNYIYTTLAEQLWVLVKHNNALSV